PTTTALLSSPDEGPGPRVAAIDQGSPEPTSETQPSLTPTPTPEPDESTLAFSDGIDLEVVASVADCWLEIYADGEQLYYDTLAAGESETFTAENRMFVRLGYPQGVELIVNGRNIGSPGGDDPIELLLPRDIRAFI
ncbi:MAG TPA: RodZ domain-containing protein, partial [Actinomycetota bacterium]|nr:RodZ domain-containing protein [Actinomycetota bacterium]